MRQAASGRLPHGRGPYTLSRALLAAGERATTNGPGPALSGRQGGRGGVAPGDARWQIVGELRHAAEGRRSPGLVRLGSSCSHRSVRADILTTGDFSMHPSRSPRGVSDLFWSFMLLVAPLLAGLVVHFSIGWWAGLGAFMVTGLVIGLAASRSGRDRIGS